MRRFVIDSRHPAAVINATNVTTVCWHLIII